MIKPISWIDPLSRKDFTLYVEAMSLISLIWSEVDLAETRINGKTAMEKPDFKIFYDLCNRALRSIKKHRWAEEITDPNARALLNGWESQAR